MEKIKYPKYRWFVLILLMLAEFSNCALIQIAPAPIIANLAATTGAELGIITTAVMGSFVFAVAVGCILSAFLLDKIGIAKTFILGFILSAVGSFLVPVLGGSVAGLYVIRLLQGLGGGFVHGSPARIAGEWFPPEERGIANGLDGAAIGFGMTIGLITSPAVFAVVGTWQMTMTVLGIVPVIGIVLSVVYMFGPEAPNASSKQQPAEGEAVPVDNFKLVLKEPLFYIAIAIMFFFAWVQQGYSTFAPGYLANELGMSEAAAGSVFSVNSLAFTIGATLCGFIARYIFKNSFKTTIAVGFIVAAAFNVLILVGAVNTSNTILATVFTVSGFFLGWCCPLLFAFLTELYPVDVLGRVGGITQGLGTFGASIGIAICSGVLDSTGSYVLPIIVFGAVCLVGFALTLSMYKPKVFAK